MKLRYRERREEIDEDQERPAMAVSVAPTPSVITAPSAITAPGPQVPPGEIRVGDFLISRGMVTAAQVDEALQQQKGTGIRLGEMLVNMGLLGERGLVEALAAHFDMPVADLRSEHPRPGRPGPHPRGRGPRPTWPCPSPWTATSCRSRWPSPAPR